MTDEWIDAADLLPGLSADQRRRIEAAVKSHRRYVGPGAQLVVTMRGENPVFALRGTVAA